MKVRNPHRIKPVQFFIIFYKFNGAYHPMEKDVSKSRRGEVKKWNKTDDDEKWCKGEKKGIIVDFPCLWRIRLSRVIRPLAYNHLNTAFRAPPVSLTTLQLPPLLVAPISPPRYVNPTSIHYYPFHLFLYLRSCFVSVFLRFPVFWLMLFIERYAP